MKLDPKSLDKIRFLKQFDPNYYNENNDEFL